MSRAETSTASIYHRSVVYVLFIILLLRSFSLYAWSRLRGRTIAWDKTKRFKGIG